MSARKLTKKEEKQLAKNRNISEGMREYWAKRKAANLGVEHQKEPAVEPLKEPEVKPAATVDQLRGSVKARPKFEPQDEVEARLLLTEADFEDEAFKPNSFEFVLHPILLYRAVKRTAELDRELKEQQMTLKATKAELDVELRRKAVDEGAKLTDKACESAVESDMRVVELKWKVMETEFSLDLAKSESEAMKARTLMLVQLGGR